MIRDRFGDVPKMSIELAPWDHFFHLSSVPPSPPEVRDSGGFPLGDTVGPYDEGESMAITCLAAESGSPPPKLTWQVCEIRPYTVRSAVFGKTQKMH